VRPVPSLPPSRTKDTIRLAALTTSEPVPNPSHLELQIFQRLLRDNDLEPVVAKKILPVILGQISMRRTFSTNIEISAGVVERIGTTSHATASGPSSRNPHHACAANTPRSTRIRHDVSTSTTSTRTRASLSKPAPRHGAHRKLSHVTPVSDLDALIAESYKQDTATRSIMGQLPHSMQRSWALIAYRLQTTSL